MELVFKIKNTKQLSRIKIYGKRVYFMDFVNGNWLIQEVSKVLEKMAKRKTKEGQQKEFLELIEKMNVKIKDMEDQNEVQEYIIKEMEIAGFKLGMIIRPGHRPIKY